jgi:hypothetical protein
MQYFRGGVSQERKISQMKNTTRGSAARLLDDNEMMMTTTGAQLQ